MRAAYLKANRRVRDAVLKFNRRAREAGRPVLPVFFIEVPDVPISVPRPDVLPSQKTAPDLDDFWVYTWPVTLQNAVRGYWDELGFRGSPAPELTLVAIE